MFVEIVTPEATVFKGEAEVVTVPGINGAFQMLDNHAPIVSLLQEGKLKLKGNAVEIDNPVAAKLFSKEGDEFVMEIQGGTVEMSNNRIIVLVD